MRGGGGGLVPAMKIQISRGATGRAGGPQCKLTPGLTAPGLTGRTPWE